MKTQEHFFFKLTDFGPFLTEYLIAYTPHQM